MHLQILHLLALNIFMNLKITKSDIKSGKIHDPANCAIARSIKRGYAKKHKMNDIVDVNVFADHASISVYESNKIVTYSAKMNNKATQFVYNFDNNVRVKPLYLNIPFKQTNCFKACV